MPILLLGCSHKKEVGTVAGQVTINGNPMTTGRIEFSNQEKNIAINANIKEDDTYVAKTYDTKGLPTGNY